MNILYPVLLYALVGILILGLLLIVMVIRRTRKRLAGFDSQSSLQDLSGKEHTGEEEHFELHVEPEELITTSDQQANPLVEPILAEEIIRHYNSFMMVPPVRVELHLAEVGFAIYPPKGKRGWWTYATAGISRLRKHQSEEQQLGVEIIICSYQEEERVLMHLAELAHQIVSEFRLQGRVCKPGDMYALSREIVDKSSANYVLVIPPYFEEEGFEYYVDAEGVVQVLTLIPITEREHSYAATFGSEELERRFELALVNTLDYYRESVV